MPEILCHLALPTSENVVPTRVVFDSDGIVTEIEPLSTQAPVAPSVAPSDATAPSSSLPPSFSASLSSSLRGDDNALPLLTPGLSDLHNHGGAGESFPTSDYEGCRRAARHHRSFGSTTLLASTVSQKRDVLLPQLEILARLCEEDELDGIHAEGPFVNACRCGAQDPDAIVPGDPDFFREMIEATQGHMRSITFAPETAHARELADLCAQHDIIVSLGHTDADYETTNELIDYALERGANVTATHLFNAMPAIHHRKPGPICALIDGAAQKRLHVEIIADGVHLHDGTASMVMDSVDYAHATFVSDAMGAAGCADGNYVLGALAVTVKGGVARLTTTDGSDGAIAGGTSRVSDQVRRHLQRGLPVHKVLQSATSGHALVSQRAGLNPIAVGQPLDAILWDASLQVQSVYRKGRVLDKVL